MRSRRPRRRPGLAMAALWLGAAVALLGAASKPASAPAAGTPPAASGSSAAALPSTAAPATSPGGSVPGAPAGEVRVPLGDGLTASLTDEPAIYVEATPRPGEGVRGFSLRLTGKVLPALSVADAKGGRKPIEVGQRYRIPWAALAPERQLQVANALFPDDKPQADGWRHQVRGAGPLQRESLWRLAEWFTGNGENFRAIREYNELAGADDVARGTSVVVPAELLLPAFRGSIPAAESSFHLEYGKDDGGEYAIYRLRPHEALYSSVVVRFTGRIHAADVNVLATQIARRSGIADVTGIPVGYRVKIPFDLLQPEFLPEGHPLRTEYEASLRASARYSNHVRALGLEGITVILDAGHGGKDSGATQAGVWESLYVYDIAVRAKRLLETRTAAKVVATTRDGDDFEIADTDVLPFSRRRSVLTDPPYPIEDPTVGVHLRWYLANSVYRKAVQQAGDPEKVVFLSIHADSLHPSLRGAMAYIPAAAMRDDSFGKTGPVYALRKEFQESPRVSFPWEERVKSEGLSRALAKQIVAAFLTSGLAVHPDKPVREKIIRGGSEWVPAVLRYNTVPAKMLLEVCNLNNPEDRRLLQTRAYRQKVAEAIYRGLLGYYGKGVAVPETQIAKTK